MIERWRWVLGVAVLLSASPAWSDGDECRTDCVSKADDTHQRCMARCPETLDPEKPGPFRACATRCQAQLDKKFSECSERCVKPTKGPTGKRKGEQQQSP